jgi:hypothetical protein
MNSATTSTWGYAVPEDDSQTSSGASFIGDFGDLADYDADIAATNTSSGSISAASTGTYAGVPTTSSPATVIKQTTTTASDDTTNVYFGARTAISQAAGSYKGLVRFTVVSEAVPPIPNVPCVSGSAFKWHIGDIRDAGTTTASWQDGDNGIARDTRNGQDYCIGKLADGKVWMLNNLKLGSMTEDITLTPATSNITASWTLPKIDNTIITTNDFETPRVYSYWDDLDTSHNGGNDPTAGKDITTNDFYGYHYNWCAATAGGTGTAAPGTCTNGSTLPNDAAGDICPANWHMPYATNANSLELSSSNQVLNLVAKLAGYPDADDAQFQSDFTDAIIIDGFSMDLSVPFSAPFQFNGAFRGVFAGLRYGPNWNRQDGYDYLWSSSSRMASDSSLALYWAFMSGGVRPGSPYSRSNGFSIRCLLQ